MAVQARPMNLLLPSPDHFTTTTTTNNNRDFIKPNQGFVDISNITAQMPTPTTMTGLWPYPPTGVMVKPHPESIHFPIYQSDLGSGKAESGLTSNNFTAPSRKRTRRSVYDPPPPPPTGLFDQQIINHHHSEIDRFIAIHTEKVRMEMQERKTRQSRMLVTAIEERVVKKLKEKDEEIERMGKLNWVLQERVKRLCLENQLWRDLAETNEATVNSLRNNLEQVLSSLAGAGEERKAVAVAVAEAEEEEAESSCCGSNDYGRETKEERGGGGGGRCRKCGEAEARVLVLPCRHLCLCTMCGSTLHNCPVCNSAINASVHVNFS